MPVIAYLLRVLSCVIQSGLCDVCCCLPFHILSVYRGAHTLIHARDLLGFFRCDQDWVDDEPATHNSNTTRVDYAIIMISSRFRTVCRFA